MSERKDTSRSRKPDHDGPVAGSLFGAIMEP